MSTQSIKQKQTVNVPASEVFSAFTNATALCEWLCDVAQAEAYKGGRVYLWWNSGYFASGEFTELVPDERIVFTWHGRGEPGMSLVKIRLKPVEAGTKISLSHTAAASPKTWKQTAKEFKRGWKKGLENLQSVLETGQDLRLIRRPLLGVSSVQEVDETIASNLGLPRAEGLHVGGTIEGMGAQAAGLRTNDVILKIDGKKVKNFPALTNALQGHHPGDKIKVTYSRSGQLETVKIKLSQRPIPVIPGSAEDLAQAVKKNYSDIQARLKEVFAQATDDAINFRPDPSEWSAREVLAHLIASERENHAWITGLIEGQDFDFGDIANQPARLKATVAAFSTLPNLLNELKRNQAETISILNALPPEFVTRKRSYWRLAYALLDSPSHYQDHYVQLQALIDAAKLQAEAASDETIQKFETEPLGE